MTSQAVPILLQGMHGMGDNLHQRAIVRQLLAAGRRVYLETPWPCIYHDLAVGLVRKPSRLRTQARNERREASAYTALPPAGARPLRVWYSGDDVRRRGSVLAAMLHNAGCSLAGADFSLPVPSAWLEQADARLRAWKPHLPVLLYRPLVERTEWGGCAARNPDYEAYYQILQAVRDGFFVVSVADLVPKIEWLVGRAITPDVELHHGELAFEELAGLAARSTMVYCSPGFAAILGQAVGTPTVCIFGGYENSSSFADGARHAPYLGIDPITPCSCFSHKHRCRKAIDVPTAIQRLEQFVEKDYASASAHTGAIKGTGEIRPADGCLSLAD